MACQYTMSAFLQLIELQISSELLWLANEVRLCYKTLPSRKIKEYLPGRETWPSNLLVAIYPYEWRDTNFQHPKHRICWWRRTHHAMYRLRSKSVFRWTSDEWKGRGARRNESERSCCGSQDALTWIRRCQNLCLRNVRPWMIHEVGSVYASQHQCMEMIS